MTEKFSPAQLLRLAQEFEEAVPPTHRSGLVDFKDPVNSIDVVETKPLDKFELECLELSSRFDEIIWISQDIKNILKSFDPSAIYSLEGVTGKIRRLKTLISEAAIQYTRMC